MIHHDLELTALRQLDQLFGLLRRRSEWFFDEDVLAILQGSFRQIEVGPHRGNDSDGVNFGRSQELRVVRHQLDAWMGLCRTSKTGGILVANCGELTAFQSIEIPDYIRSPIAVADHAD